LACLYLLKDCVSTIVNRPTADPGARRYWRRFQQLMQLPEKDQRAVFRTLDTMTKASKAGKSKASQA